MRLDAKTYQNLILTVIAVLLLVLAAQIPVRLNLESKAYAQGEEKTSIAPAVPDRQLANATMQVAAANKDIALQLEKISKSIQMVSRSISLMATGKTPVPAGGPGKDSEMD